MKRITTLLLALTSGLLGSVSVAHADNPLFLDQFSADPTARNFNGKVYLFNSHDILPPNGSRGGFFMADYHVHSSEDLMDWKDHGVIVDQKDVPWANQNYGMWAPDCVFKNGKYYFYFPTNSKDVTDSRGGRGRRQGIQRVGVAVADNPEGPYKIEPIFIPNIPPSIDPSVLIDPKDGSAYLIYAMNDFFLAKLKDNMLEMAEEPQLMTKFPDTRSEGLIEGPFAFERNGKYYMAYPHAMGTERLEYAMADNPRGPYSFKGVLMDQLASKCWTNQCSLVEYKGQWLIFYHDKDLSPRDDARRSVRADYLTFNEDGTINKVIPTLRGVGTCDARRHIQIDRYSAISKTALSTLSSTTTRRAKAGRSPSPKRTRSLSMTVSTSARAISNSSRFAPILQVVARLKSDSISLTVRYWPRSRFPSDSQWKEVSATLMNTPSAIHNLVVNLHEQNTVEIDWVSFE